MPTPSLGEPLPLPAPRAALRATQIIVVVLAAGLLTGSGVLTAMALTNSGGAAPTGPSAPSPGLAGVFGLLVPSVQIACGTLAFVMPAFLRRTARRQWNARTDDDLATRAAVQSFQSAVILRGGLLEGPGLLGAVAVLITGQLYFLFAPAIALILIAISFPTQTALQRWLDDVTLASGAEDRDEPAAAGDEN